MGMTCMMCRVGAQDFQSVEKARLAQRVLYGAEGAVDLDKSWDGLLWLISEERRKRKHMLPDPELLETQALMPVEHLDGASRRVGYATPDRVTEISKALDKIDPETLRAHYQPRAMRKASVYPNIWDEPDSFDYLADYFATLRNTYRKAAAAGDYVLVAIG